MTFFGREPIFFDKFDQIFYWHSLLNRIGDYTASLSSIEQCNKNTKEKSEPKFHGAKNQLRLTLEF